MKNQKGFTLIELLLVLAIIGIISAIAIPALLGQRARARDKSVVANVTSIVSDMVALYDSQKDTGATITLGALTGALPQFAKAKNPWDASKAAYVAGVCPAGTAASRTTPAVPPTPPAVPGTVGQTDIGYLAPASGLSGAVGATGFLNAPVAGSTTFSTIAGID